MIRRRQLAALAAAVLLGLAAAPRAAWAHDARPIYLELKETGPGRFSVLWRTPVLAGSRLPVALKLPDGVQNLREPTVQTLTDSLLERREVDAGPDGLVGKRITFPGLQLTITDVLVRVERLDGTHSTELVRPQRPYIELAASPGLLATARTFLVSGIEHIAFGADHLLFVLGLLLIVRTRWMLVKTITAFTAAHSITLTLATLGVVNVPRPPLEAMIAVSIFFLGPEIVRFRRGETSFTIRHPWVVAFAFGLLHGFGFASGLAAIGLPQGEIPLALLTFNLGVEIGQLAFVGLVLLLARAFELLTVSLKLPWPRKAELVPAYVVGSLGALWSFQRIAVMIHGG